jgi:hypothetical protein
MNMRMGGYYGPEILDEMSEGKTRRGKERQRKEGLGRATLTVGLG